MGALDPLVLYLAIVNATTLALVALDRRLSARGGSGEAVSRTALTLLMFAGGALGGVIAIALFD